MHGIRIFRIDYLIHSVIIMKLRSFGLIKIAVNARTCTVVECILHDLLKPRFPPLELDPLPPEPLPPEPLPLPPEPLPLPPEPLPLPPEPLPPRKCATVIRSHHETRTAAAAAKAAAAATRTAAAKSAAAAARTTGS